MKRKFRIRFSFPNGQVSGETVWAEKVGENTFRLLNIPYFVFGYAENDIVHCVEQGDSIEVINLKHNSGNGTLRLVFVDLNDDAQKVLRELSSVRCTYEIATDHLVAINVPPNLDIPFSQLSNYLNGLSDKVLTGWEIGKPFSRKLKKKVKD